MGYPTPRDAVRQGRDTRERIELLERRLTNYGSVNTPHAVATGRATAPAGGTAAAPLYYSETFTVTLPVGRFSVPPRVIVGASGVGVMTANVVGNPTASSFSAVVTRLNAPLSANSHYLEWEAIQMTPENASG